MGAALFELAVHNAMGLSFESVEKRQEYIDWFIKNHELTERGIIFKPKFPDWFELPLSQEINP